MTRYKCKTCKQEKLDVAFPTKTILLNLPLGVDTIKCFNCIFNKEGKVKKFLKKIGLLKK